MVGCTHAPIWIECIGLTLASTPPLPPLTSSHLQSHCSSLNTPLRSLFLPICFCMFCCPWWKHPLPFVSLMNFCLSFKTQFKNHPLPSAPQYSTWVRYPCPVLFLPCIYTFYEKTRALISKSLFLCFPISVAYTLLRPGTVSFCLFFSKQTVIYGTHRWPIHIRSITQ